MMVLSEGVLQLMLLQVILSLVTVCMASGVICSENPLGMESSAIPDAMVSASTSDSSHSAANARLNHNSAGWKSRSYDKDPWIQVAFQGAALLGMLSTQAPDQLDPPPEGTLFEMQLLAKGDAGEWIRYPLVLSANYEAGGEIVDFTFERSLRVTVLRLYIVTTPLIGLRMELYGCYENPDTECAVDADCDAASTCIDTYCACALSVSSLLFGSSPTCSECWSPLGLESGKIIDSQISASTSRSTGPHTNARIGNPGAWSPEDSDTSPWLMVQFNETTRVTGMRTKGEVIYILGFPNRDFVRKAKIEYGIMGNNYPIEENGEPKIFTLNNDENEVVTNIFPCPVETDFIKLTVVSPEASKVGLRLELLGCDLQTTTSPGTCTVDADCQQGPMHNCVQQRCLLVIPTTESWSTLETTSVRQTTEIVPTTEQATTDAPTTMMAQTTTEPVTTGKIVSPSEPTTEASTTTDAETTVEPTTISLPTDVTSTEAAEPSTAQPTSLASTTRTDVLSTARYTTFLMTSVDSSNTPVCLPGDVVTATGPSVNTEGVYDETVPSHSEEFLDALRREADIEGLGEQDTASLCSALAGSGGGISQGVTHVGLKVLMQVTANKTKPILSQDLVASVRFLDTVANSDWDSADANNSRATLEKMVNVGSNLLNSGNEKPWKDSEVKHTLSGPIQIVNSLEKMALKVGAKLEKESSVEVTSENIDIDLYGVSSDDLLLSGWKWNSSDAKFMAAITAQEFQMKNFSAYERALLVGGVFRNIAALSSSDIPSNDMAMSSENGQRLQSDIVTVMASGMDTISVSVSYSTPKNLGDVVIKEHEVPEFSCAFWEFNDSSTPGSGRWSDLGCYVLKSDEENSDDEVSCFCNHTTNFAVLMQVVDKPVPAEPDIHSHVLQILTYTCLTLSIISLLVSLAVFLYLGSSLASERLTIHKNLMLAMLLATVLFLLGVASNLDVIPCKIVAILLHYLFLAVFCWTLVEGIHLYRQVIAVFEQGGSKLALYYVAGWGVPAVVVGISLGIKYNLYGAGPHCWLTAKDGLIWAFVGPVILIITVNMIVLIMVVVVVTRAAALKCQTNLDRIRAACKSAMMLVPLLGISWIIGLFTQYSMALEYAFVILNGLQGFFMFVFYCLLSSEVRTALRHEMKKRADRNMDSSGNVVKTNIWTLSSNKTAHIRLVKVAPSAQNSDEA
ncbi:adhesion G protein-coupled receptor L3-like isoform X2 [Acanthaster planci]|uniref:Adhesion G protein-coupled receptor L3-like isoform X2 n=1 Tax=Acanthaster planci TaxID=133434 RepID=A0A8B7Y8B6_ACAPL|nr:adhesion G protein-coupled receptor L3-like isoform X2 [Acanthaster planci]